MIGPVNMGPGFSSQIGYVVRICAYTIFLYLNLG